MADTTVAGNRLARRWAREPRPYAPSRTHCTGRTGSSAPTTLFVGADAYIGPTGYFPRPRQGTRALPYKNARLQGGAHVSRRTLRFLLTVSLPGRKAPSAVHISPRPTKKENILSDVLLVRFISQCCSASESERSSCGLHCSCAADPWQQPYRCSSLRPCKRPRPRCDCLQRQQPRTS